MFRNQARDHGGAQRRPARLLPALDPRTRDPTCPGWRARWPAGRCTRPPPATTTPATAASLPLPTGARTCIFPAPLQYDTDVTTWSPQGRIFQIEYAMEAVKQGSAAVGLKVRPSGFFLQASALLSLLALLSLFVDGCRRRRGVAAASGLLMPAPCTVLMCTAAPCLAGPWPPAQLIPLAAG